MKRIICFLIYFFSLSSAFASDLSKIKFEYLTVEDGLSQGIVEYIIQDSQGYMWFATHDGLNRYDGVNFMVFRNDKSDPNSLAANSVDCIAEDKEGLIWIGTLGLNQYDPFTNKMTRVPVNTDDPDAYHGERILHITVDTDSTLWLSAQGGLIHYFPRTKKFKRYMHDPNNPDPPAFFTVRMTRLTRDNRLFIATETDPIYEYDREHDTFKEIQYKVAYQGKNGGKHIEEDYSGLLYITDEFSGLHILNPNTGQVKFIDKAEGGLNALNIRTKVLVVGTDEVWIGTNGGGINIYNPITGAMQYLMVDYKNSFCLSNNAVTFQFQDRDKNIWVGHFGSGISVWKRNKEKFVSYAHNPFNPASINKEIVTAIFEDSEGRIWIGQDGGGLSLFNEGEKSFEHFRARPAEPGSLTTDVILAINEDPNGNLLLGTYGGGLMVFNTETRRVIKSFNSTNGLASDHVWNILKDSKGRYWLTDYRAGFSLYDPVNYTFDNHGLNHPGLPSFSNQITNISEDASGKIWFTSEVAGFAILDYDKKTTKNYRYDVNNKNSLSDNDVKSIVFIGDYTWIATNGGGLNRFDTKKDSFKVYTRADGLSSNALMVLLKDKDNNLWISSTRGLMKFNTQTGEINTYDKSQGIQGSEFKYNAGIVLGDGRMIFGGVNGLTIFHPDSIKSSSIIPGVIFTDFKVFDKSVVPGVKGSPLKRSINFTEFIRLNHKQSVFTIEFASLDYNAPLKNRCMYKLEGFDEEWINAGNRRFVTYTNLDAGKYTFLLKGSNSDGVWNETPRKMVIRIRPPWYKTKLAILLFLTAIVLLIVYYIKQRERQAVQDKLILEHKIRAAEDELQSKTRKVEEHEKAIKRRDEEEKDIRFFTDGIAKMSDIIAKKRHHLEELTTAIISELVRYVNASAGGIFVMDDSDPGHIVLRATGDFCLSSENDIHYTFDAGEGNIGTCYSEKQTLIIDNIPDGYIVLSSGLGKISLHHAVFVPIVQDGICVGVIEIASTEKIPENRLKFLEKVAESLASVITIIKANEKSGQMIEQNNVQAEELRAQEEEMRKNLEELMATQEQSQRKEKEVLAELVSKNNLIQKLEDELAKAKKKGSK